MKKGASILIRSMVDDMIEVNFPHYIIKHQENIYGFNRGDQHRVVGAGFSHVAHLKNWYNKASLGVTGFYFIHGVSYGNISVDKFRTGGIVFLIVPQEH